MRREELRTGRIADMEFQFWECWESDENVAEALERHWFRSDTGLEAPTYDDMLQRLYWRALGLPKIQPPPPAATNEWDRRVAHTLRVNGEDVLIEIIEHYKDDKGSAPVSIKVRGPNGLLTSSYQEMLEKLGVAPARDRQQATAEPPALTGVPARPQLARGVVVAGGAVGFGVDVGAFAGVGVAAGAVRLPQDSDTSTASTAIPTPTPTSTPTPTPTAPPATAGGSAVDGRNLRDARDREEMERRVQAFKVQHPWLWDEDPYVKVDEPFNSMRLVWWGEYIKAVYPELAAAALDPEKYSEYMENYDPERPVPIPGPEDEEEEDEDAQPVAAEAAPRCQFIKADGEPCGNPALKKMRLCYFHSKTAAGRKRRKNGKADSRTAQSTGLEMPVLEDDLAIQMAVTNICRQLANETMEPKRATSLLYGIQVASVAVRRAMQNRRISDS